MAGGDGMGHLVETVHALAYSNLPIQIVAVCERNEDARTATMAMHTNVPTKALGFCRNIAELMRRGCVGYQSRAGLHLRGVCCRVAHVALRCDARSGGGQHRLGDTLRRRPLVPKSFACFGARSVLVGPTGRHARGQPGLPGSGSTGFGSKNRQRHH